MHYFTENKEYLQVTKLAVEQSRSLNQFQRIKYHKYHSQTLIQWWAFIFWGWSDVFV